MLQAAWTFLACDGHIFPFNTTQLLMDLMSFFRVLLLVTHSCQKIMH